MNERKMIKNNNYPYIVMTSTITIGVVTFWSGVSFEFMEYDDSYLTYDGELLTYENKPLRYGVSHEKHIVVAYNGNDYIIPKWACIMTTRPARKENVSVYEYQSNTYNDKTTEYFEPVKKAYGIDMKLNYAPQFKDGENPFKDGKKMEDE